MTMVMTGLERAFRYFGGVPSELLFDQMKAVVTSDGRAVGGTLVLNEEFGRFAGECQNLRVFPFPASGFGMLPWGHSKKILANFGSLAF